MQPCGQSSLKWGKRAVHRTTTGNSGGNIGQKITKNTEAILDMVAGSSPCLPLIIIPNNCVWLSWKGKSSWLAPLYSPSSGGQTWKWFEAGHGQDLQVLFAFCLMLKWHTASYALAKDYFCVLLRAAQPTLSTWHGPWETPGSSRANYDKLGLNLKISPHLSAV